MIVGPNGCGKSNIADAFRWIIGESKHRLLRIEKVENLIFNGSARRKSLPYAEVELQVADISPELPQLTFTKRVHRTGETDYLINGTPARLKDFLRYFWEMGLSSHSILDGGQVEALIQDRANARRNLLESLAGTEKYHHQRRDLVAEIEKTRQGLSEVQHLLAELSSQIALLAQQAARVEAYQKLKAAYRELLVRFVHGEISHYQSQIEQTQKEEAAFLQQIKAIEEEMDLCKTQLRDDPRESLRQQLSLVRAAQDTLTSEIQRFSQEESRLEERLSHLNKQLIAVSEERVHRQRQKEELKVHENENLMQRQAIHQRRLKLHEEVESLRLKLEAQKAHLRNQQTQYQDLLSRIQALQKQQASYVMEKNRWEAQAEAYRREEEAIRAALQQGQDKVTNYQAEASQKKTVFASLKAKLDKAVSDLRAIQKTQVEIQAAWDAGQRDITALEAAHRAKVSERTALESLLREAVDWPPRLRRLLRAHPETLLPLESVFYADEKGLALLAMLLRLEPLTLCVASEALMPTVLEAISQEAEGLIRLIPVICKVSSQTPTPPHPEALHLPTLVKPLPRLEGLAEMIWGDVWVVPTPLTPPVGYRYLHLEKRLLLTPIGTYHFLGLPKIAHIGLPHRIAALRAQEQAQQTQLSALQAKQAERRAALQALPLQAAKEAVERLQQAFLTEEKALVLVETRLSEAQKLLTQTEQRLEALQEMQLTHQAHLDSILAALQEVETQIQQLQVQAQAAAAQEAHLQTQVHALSTEYQEQRHQLIQVEERLRQEEKHQKLMAQQMEEVRKRLAYLTDQETRYGQEYEATQSRIEEVRMALLTHCAEAESVSQRCAAIEKELATAESALKAIETQLLAHQARREQLLERLHRLQNRRQDAHHHMQMLAQRLHVETDLHLTDLKGVPPARLSAQEVEARLQALRTEMNALGELNFEAFSALETQKARLSSLQEQKRDIETALSQLEQVLSHLDREAEQRFSQAFEAVRAAFTKQFREIFSEEDTCDLVLVEPEKPLSSPIEIIAKPRGKRPLSLNQLSGGEKALTVLALLMGVLSIRPPAITILDEVDAPLDDLNAEKFGQLLRRFSEHSQVLVITHNKITISHAEVLYGVTMPEPGVSAILGVEMKAVRQEAILA